MAQYIYADNAATTKLDIDAFEAMKPYLLDEYGNPSQPYFFSKRPKMAIKKAREIIADCIGAEPKNIFFTSGGTESDNWAIKCFGAAPGDVHIIATSSIEHHAILNACDNHSEMHEWIHLSVDKNGLVSPNELYNVFNWENRPICTCMTFLASVMFANNEIGTIQPIKELVEAAHKRGAAFHTDAVQAVGHVPINVKELGVDLLSASAHKFNGPKGVGFLYDSGKHVYAHNDGGSQEFGMRAGTENVAGIVGMAVALQKNCQEMDKNIAHIKTVEAHFIDRMNNSGLDFVRNGSSNHLPGLVSISFKGADGEALLHRLDLMKICVSTGSACDSVNTQVSHVLKAIGLSNEYAKGTIRISFGKHNTIEEADTIADALIKILGQN